MKSLRVLLFSLMACLPVTPVTAEDSEDFQDLLLNIANELDASSTTGATKQLQSSLGAPAIIKVFTQKDIAKFDSVYDLLGTVPGIVIDDTQFNRRAINIRSITNALYVNKVLLMINGFKMNEGTAQHMAIDVIPKEAIKRLEIIKGPGSVLYGSNAYAGVISITTFDGSGYDDDEASVTLGEGGTRGGSYKFFRKDEKANHFFSLKYFYENGGVRDGMASINEFSSQPNGYLQGLANPSLFVRRIPGEASDFQLEHDNFSMFGMTEYKDFHFSYGKGRVYRTRSYEDAKNTAGLPFWGGMYASFNPPFGMFDSGRIREESLLDQQFFGVEKTFKINSKTSLKTLFKYMDFEEDVLSWDKSMFQVYNDSESTEFELQVSHQANDKLNMILGYDREYTNFYQSVYGANVSQVSNFFKQVLPTLPANHPLYGRVAGFAAMGDEFAATRPGSWIVDGIYLQSIYNVNDKLSLLVANRRNEHHTEKDTLGHKYSPKYALTYKLRKDEFVKVIYGKAFRYAAPFEMYAYYPQVGWMSANTIFPEEVESMEYNWVRRFDDGKKEVSLTYFDMDLDNLIQAGQSGYENVRGTIKNKGFEFEYRQEQNEKTTWWVNGLLGEYDSSGIPAVNETMRNGAGSWEKQFTAGAEYRPDKYWGFSAWSKYVGYRPGRPDGGDSAQGGVTVHNLGLSYSHSKEHKVRLEISNLFDKDYKTMNYVVANAKMETPPKGREITVTYTVKF
jgi:outer membrane receptor protein involved in Fe transport